MSGALAAGGISNGRLHPLWLARVAPPALGGDKRDLGLPQDGLVRLRDELAVAEKGSPGDVDLLVVERRGDRAGLMRLLRRVPDAFSDLYEIFDFRVGEVGILKEA